MYYFPGINLTVKDSFEVVSNFHNRGVDELRALQVPYGFCIDLYYEGGKLVKCYPAGTQYGDLLHRCAVISGIQETICVERAILRGFVTVQRKHYDAEPEIYGSRLDRINSRIEEIFTTDYYNDQKKNLTFLLDVVEIPKVEESEYHLDSEVRKGFTSLASSRCFTSANIVDEYRALLRRVLNSVGSSQFLVDKIRITTSGDLTDPESFFNISTHAAVRVLKVKHIEPRLTKGGRVVYYVYMHDDTFPNEKNMTIPDPNMLRAMGIVNAGTELYVATTDEINTIVRVREHNHSGRRFNIDLRQCPICALDLDFVNNHWYCRNRRCSGQVYSSLKYYFKPGMLDTYFASHEIDHACEYFRRCKNTLPIALFDKELQSFYPEMYAAVQKFYTAPLHVALLMLEIRAIDRAHAVRFCEGYKSLAAVLEYLKEYKVPRVRNNVREYLSTEHGINTVKFIDKIRGVK